MSKINTIVDIERGIATLIDTQIFYMQKIRQGNYFSAEDREKALKEVEASLPTLKRLLWKVKNLEQPVPTGNA